MDQGVAAAAAVPTASAGRHDEQTEDVYTNRRRQTLETIAQLRHLAAGALDEVERQIYQDSIAMELKTLQRINQTQKRDNHHHADATPPARQATPRTEGNTTPTSPIANAILSISDDIMRPNEDIFITVESNARHQKEQDKNKKRSFLAIQQEISGEGSTGSTDSVPERTSALPRVSTGRDTLPFEPETQQSKLVKLGIENPADMYLQQLLWNMVGCRYELKAHQFEGYCRGSR